MPEAKQAKIGQVRSLMCRLAGASLDDICKATGWRIHSARTVLSTLRKNGAVIIRRQVEHADAAATYHLVAGAKASA